MVDNTGILYRLVAVSGVAVALLIAMIWRFWTVIVANETVKRQHNKSRVKLVEKVIDDMFRIPLGEEIAVGFLGTWGNQSSESTQ